MATSNHLIAKNKDTEIKASSQHTDSPFINPQYIEKFKETGVLDWYLKETSKEADFRRTEEIKKSAEKSKETWLGLFILIFAISPIFALLYIVYLISQTPNINSYVLAAMVVGGIGAIGYLIKYLTGRK